MRNAVPTAYTAVPIGVTDLIGHVRRNQRSRCRNPPGHVPGTSVTLDRNTQHPAAMHVH